MPREAKRKISGIQMDHANQEGKVGKVLYIPFLIKELRR